jgi:hypothetical protein
MEPKGSLKFKSFLIKNSTTFIILLSAFIQAILVGRFFDNSVISGYAPTAIDAADYSNRVEVWQDEGFNKAFSDAYRMPGYSTLLLLMHTIFPSSPNLAMRLFQLFAIAFSAGLIKITLQQYVSLKISIAGSLIFILLPIWHFVPVLIGESMTAFFASLLVYLLGRVQRNTLSWKLLLAISLCIALATYLKPNNLLLLIPTLGFLIASSRNNLTKQIIKIILIVFVLLLPWIIFANKVQPGFLGLTTNSGVNMYVGTGMILDYNEGVLSKSATKWNVDPRSNPLDRVSADLSQNPSETDAAYRSKAIEIWKERPLSQLGYGLDKVSIAFGLKANSLFDLILGLFNILALFSGVILFRSHSMRAWGTALILVMLAIASQAVVFQADRRFVVPVVFPFAAITLGILLNDFSDRISMFKFANSFAVGRFPTRTFRRRHS